MQVILGGLTVLVDHLDVMTQVLVFVENTLAGKHDIDAMLAQNDVRKADAVLKQVTKANLLAVEEKKDGKKLD